MASNRLKLDFSLTTDQERSDFLNKYLQEEQFKKFPPTNDELETMGNYLLWGKNPETGLNAEQEYGVNIKTKHGTWDKDGAAESLEALMEQPTFNEAQLAPIGGTHYRVKKEKFSREDALRDCPPEQRQSFTELFDLIDELEIMINFYEIAHNKREKPPRDFLLNKFAALIPDFQEKVTHWNQYRYLRARHQLVEMRREQYTLRDFYKQTILAGSTCVVNSDNVDVDFDAGILVLPLGIKGKNHISRLVFRDWEKLIPMEYGEQDLEEISDFYWEKKNSKPSGNQKFVDFRDLEHVYELFNMFFDLEDAAAGATVGSNLPGLMDTLKFYVKNAELSELHQEILDLKLRKVKNVDIAAQINKKWNKSYTPNYISTIFRQRIIPKINDAAAYHELVVSNIFFPEEFKVCSGCGKTLLRDAKNFTRKARSKDGFSARCKKCEKKTRTGKED